MASKDKLPLQEQILTLLCYNQQYGRELAAQLDPNMFDGVYRDFAVRVLQYWKRHKLAPGVGQTEDLAALADRGKEEGVASARLLPRMLAMRKAVNPKHAADRIGEFVLKQRIKSTIVEATDRWEQDDDLMVDDVQKIFAQGATKYQGVAEAAGLRLTDPQLLQFASKDDDFVSLGIKELDRQGIGLTRQEMLLYIAPKGSGKTWFCTHCGKMALLQRLKVLHVSLEMGEQKIGRRYLQSLFAVSRNKETIRRARLLFDNDEDKYRTTKFKVVRQTPKLHFQQGRIRRILRRKQRQFGTRIGNLVVKEFPSGTLTMEKLIGYLDFLEAKHLFVPDVLIVDYPDLMAISTRTRREDIGNVFVHLRGLAQMRNMALVTPTQGTRATIRAQRVRSTGVAEDISKILTADTTLTYSRTEEEESIGLGRMSIEHARDSEGQTIIVLEQNYAMGQYVTNSALMGNAFWDQVKALRQSDTEDSN